ncbi:MAG: glycosyltransferase family 2 protein [Planctomycetota bacterium]
MISAVVVNWNGRHYLEACLASLLAQDPPPDEIIVADNHSDDGSREMVAAQFPGVVVVDTGRNGGPGLARNVGVALAQHDLVLLVDNDVVLQPGALRALHAERERHPTTVLVQARSLCHDRPDIVHYDAARLHFLGLLVLDHFFEPLAQAASADRPVGAVVGLCVLVGRADYQRVGGFHEELFFYFEDTEFAWRLRLAGGELRVASSAHVLHRGGTADLSLRKGRAMPRARTYYHSRNRLTVCLTCLSWRSILLLLPAQLAYEAVQFAFAVSNGHGITWWRGKFGLLRLVPRLWTWRQAAQRSRVVSDRDLLVGEALTVHPGVADRGAAAALRRGLDRFWRGYWRWVGPLCR